MLPNGSSFQGEARIGSKKQKLRILRSWVSSEHALKMIVFPFETFLEWRKVFQPFSRNMVSLPEKLVATQMGPWGHPSERSHITGSLEAIMIWAKDSGRLTQRRIVWTFTRNSFLSIEGGEASRSVCSRVMCPPLPLPLPRHLPRPRTWTLSLGAMEKVVEGRKEEGVCIQEIIPQSGYIYSYKGMINQFHKSKGRLPMSGDIYEKSSILTMV